MFLEDALRLVGASILLGLLGSTPAFAGDCATPYTVEAMLGDLTGIETGLRSDDKAAAAASGQKMRDGLGCLNEVLPAMIAARSYRAVGGGLFAADDLEGAKKWFRTALELDPTYIYGLQDLPDEHPIRDVFNALKDEVSGDATALDGKDFPPEAQHYLDGRKLSSPKARLDRYHLFQADKDGLSSWLIEGNAFPDSALVEAEVPEPVKEKKPGKEKKPKVAKEGRDPKPDKEGKPAKAKEPKKTKNKNKGPRTKTGPNGEVVYLRKRPVEKTPLMIAGAVVVAGAAGIYYSATRSKAKFKSIMTAADVNEGLDISQPFDLCGVGQDTKDGCNADPSQEIKRRAGATNRLVLASGAVAAVGVGLFSVGAIVDGDAVIPTVTIRW